MSKIHGKYLADKSKYEYEGIRSEDFQFICNNSIFELKDNNYSFIEPGFISKSLASNDFQHTINSLHFLIEGSAEMTFDGKTIPLSAGDIFLISNQVKCTWEYKEPSSEVTLLFNYYLGSLDDLLEHINQPMIIHDCQSDVLKIRKLFENDDFISYFKIKNLSAEYIVEFLQMSNADLTAHVLLAKKYADVFLYIHEHLSVDLHLEELAEATNRSVGFFSKKFVKEVGCSTKQYINDKIMADVEQLLIYSEMSIGEISDRFKFCEQSYFTRWFKRQKGCTPLVYRNKWKTI